MTPQQKRLLDLALFLDDPEDRAACLMGVYAVDTLRQLGWDFDLAERLTQVPDEDLAE